jgi:transcriptional regulator GlxA family with amidase domain
MQRSVAASSTYESRNFARCFNNEVCKTPAKHSEDLHLEAARREIESTAMTLEEIVTSCGFTSAETLL